MNKYSLYISIIMLFLAVFLISCTTGEPQFGSEYITMTDGSFGLETISVVNSPINRVMSYGMYTIVENGVTYVCIPHFNSSKCSQDLREIPELLDFELQFVYDEQKSIDINDETNFFKHIESLFRSLKVDQNEMLYDFDDVTCVLYESENKYVTDLKVCKGNNVLYHESGLYRYKLKIELKSNDYVVSSFCQFLEEFYNKSATTDTECLGILIDLSRTYS